MSEDIVRGVTPSQSQVYEMVASAIVKFETTISLLADFEVNQTHFEKMIGDGKAHPVFEGVADELGARYKKNAYQSALETQTAVYAAFDKLLKCVDKLTVTTRECGI